jgi:hypothetical protein
VGIEFSNAGVSHSSKGDSLDLHLLDEGAGETIWRPWDFEYAH